MIPGLMQETPLLTTMILRHGARVHGSREIVSRKIEGGIHRYDYAHLEGRCARLANALLGLGVTSGSRVVSLAWNTHRHLELFYAVPGLGAVLHTVNPRLHTDQIRFIINHGGAGIVIFDRNLSELVETLAPHLPQVRTYIALTDEDGHDVGAGDIHCYESLLKAAPDSFDWPQFDERAGACLCYTSGTTGDPKGILYSHRSIVLEAMGASLSGGIGYRASDCVMPAASLYHAMGWAMPYTAPMNGCKLVLPADKLDGASLHEIIQDEGVTISAGVPTIWTNYLDHIRTRRLSTNLKRLIIGGSALPRSLAEGLAEHGIDIVQGWGMTETSSLGTMGSDLPSLEELSPEARHDVLWSRQGCTPFGVEIRVVDDAGSEVPWDGRTLGNLLIRGPWVLRRYFAHERDATDRDGWFDTGDVVTIDRFGFIGISDRKKDLIKSGGEWISSLDLENIALGIPGIQSAAVIGVPHARWQERPLLLVIPQSGSRLDPQAILRLLGDRVAKWWLPDDVVFVEELPLTATGKMDKKELRRRYAGHLVSG